jgi:UDP-N-acetylmuramoyl-tripeptide--D-alanyl-D-alanine ligase
VITTVGPAHLELVGSLENVARAKSELLAALPAGSRAIVPESLPVERRDLDLVRVADPEARVEEGWTVLAFGSREIRFDFTARHQAQNALFALHAAAALGIEPDAVIEVKLSPWRDQVVELPGGGLLINDAYNANPVSMRAALEHLVERAGPRRPVAVLGDMAELGPDAARYHVEIGDVAAELGVSVLAVGELARGYRPAQWAADADEAAALLADFVRTGDCVLVKGSRAIGLETVADALAAVQR